MPVAGLAIVTTDPLTVPGPIETIFVPGALVTSSISTKFCVPVAGALASVTDSAEMTFAWTAAENCIVT